MYALKMIVPAALLSLGLLGSITNTAQAADRYALLEIHNRTDAVINFQIKFGDGAWQDTYVAPGESVGIYAGFSYPGSYDHDPIHIRFDDDMTSAHHWREIFPYVSYAPDIDYSRAQQYYFDYDGSTGRYIELFYL
ncbi:MAG: hypothetical protein RIC55_20495 [Pirellulaceae bacterium]